VQAATESLNGGRDAVDPRKIDVRDHHDAHARSQAE
jgi:hypothetical protein